MFRRLAGSVARGVGHPNRGGRRYLGVTVSRKALLEQTMPHSKLDEIDWKILAKLQENARIANVELADDVHLSPSPCLARVKALEADGFISRYVTLLDPRSVGLEVSVFVRVRLEKQIESAFRSFETAVMGHAGK